MLPRKDSGAGGAKDCGAEVVTMGTDEDWGAGDIGLDGAGVELEEYDAERRALMFSPEPKSVVTIFRRVLRAHMRWLGAVEKHTI